LDTLYLFRLFIKYDLKSNKLIDIYNYLYNSQQNHRAKADVFLIIEIMRKLNINNESIISII